RNDWFLCSAHDASPNHHPLCLSGAHLWYVWSGLGALLIAGNRPDRDSGRPGQYSSAPQPRSLSVFPCSNYRLVLATPTHRCFVCQADRSAGFTAGKRAINERFVGLLREPGYFLWNGLGCVVTVREQCERNNVQMVSGTSAHLRLMRV